MTIPLGVAKAILADESYPLRFEKFSADLVSKIEGDVRVLTTSSNYDQGRDATSVGAGPKVVVCCSLADDVDPKATADANKIKKTTKDVDRLYFCSSQNITEYSADILAAKIGLLAGCQGKVTVLSRAKLAEFSTSWSDVLRKHYPTEVRAAVRALAEESGSSQADQSLRLALSVAGGDSSVMREAVWETALRRVLSDGSQRTLNELAVRLSTQLRLSTALRAESILVHVDRLIESGQVSSKHGLYKLTEQGLTEHSSDEERVARSTLEGRHAFTDAVTEALRYELAEPQANAMWSSVQDALANLLYSRGQEVLALLSPLLGRKKTEDTDITAGTRTEPLPEVDRPRVHQDIVEPIANAAANAFTLPAQADEVRTAIADLFHSGEGPAVEWLSRACYAFVCACALGLEFKTQAALEAVIGQITLVLDTDVVLSLLSADETPHELVRAVVKRWRECGGKIAVPTEVLQEVAYHAWIAERDFDNVSDLWPGSPLDRQVLSKNAFARGFGLLMQRKEVRVGQWKLWIGQFRGKDDADISAIRSTLHKDYSFGELPPPNSEYRKIAQEAVKYLERKAGRKKKPAAAWDQRDEFIRTDKARRDARLFASMLQALASGRDALSDGDKGYYLVTSSSRFRDVERQFRPDETSFVLSTPAAAYMLSMVPGQALGLTALRAFLFDGRWSERISDFELLALRVVRRGTEFDMPWAKRRQLLRYLRSEVESEARERTGKRRASAQAIEAVERDWTSGQSEKLLGALARGLDAVAADRRTETELAEAKAKIIELEQQLRKERTRSKKEGR